jgi:formylglycine-generating enzyme required for sulfatase activity
VELVEEGGMMVGKLRFAAGFAVALIFGGGSVAIAGSGTDRVQAGKTFRDCAECSEMVVVPAGKFLMGSSEADAQRDFAAVPGSGYKIQIPLWPSNANLAKSALAEEYPQHSVTISKTFAFGKYDVTTGEFAAFVRATGYFTSPCTIWSRPRAQQSTGGAWPHPGFAPSDRDPVVCVSWKDAQAYIDWLNIRLRGDPSTVGKGPYRLPSEAEWEYAARAGTQTARWWGDAIGQANAKCDGCIDFESNRQPVPVGRFPPNAFGLYDMLGNAWQWTQDCWRTNYMGAPSDGSPQRDVNCSMSVFRGGSWNSLPWVLRSATRRGMDIDSASSDIGFRVAKTLE